MADESVPMPDDDQDEPIQQGDELPVKLDTLMVGGERPNVGDQVDVKVSGTISRIIDDCAYVSVDQANDNDIEKPVGDNEGQAIANQAREMDMAGTPVGDITSGSGIGY